MKRILLGIGFIAATSCAGRGERAPDNDAAETPTPCAIVLKRTCVVPGETKCLAYATEELSNCKEGN